MTQGRDDLTDGVDDEFSLQPVLRTLWSYRRTIQVAFAITVILCIVGALLLYAAMPRERVSSLTFLVTFEGADRDEYPNGTKFSSSEIVSSPVLTDVFNANDLQRYLQFAEFKDSMFVLHANRDLELLSYEYQTKLADPKLSPVDRARLEQEFRTKMDSLRSAEYSLNIRRREGLAWLPEALLSKVLQDTLSTWARHAAERKGAILYDIPVLSKNALQKDFIAAEDYIIAVDILRTKIERILKTLTMMQQIPGASAVRMGQEQIGLADMVANLEDLKRFKVEPLIGIIRAGGLSRNPTRMDQYFEGRLFEVKLRQTETNQRIKSLQEALRDYEQRSPADSTSAVEGRGATVTPQLSESFIDKLVQLSTRSVDMDYRQDLAKRIIDDGMVLAELNREAEYYEAMRRSFAEGRLRGSTDGAAADVARRTGLAFDELSRAMGQVQAIYRLITEQNLNPDNVLYSITRPFTVRTTSALSLRTTVLYLFATLFVGIIVIPVACLAHSYFRHWISPRKPTHPTPNDTQRPRVDVAGV